MTLTRLILEPLGLALVMMILGWILDRLRPRASISLAEARDRPRGAWDRERTRPRRESRERSSDEVSLHWH